jgi:hypothetical protein
VRQKIQNFSKFKVNFNWEGLIVNFSNSELQENAKKCRFQLKRITGRMKEGEDWNQFQASLG